MIEQDIINWLLIGLGSLLGFVLRVVWGALKDLQHEDRILAEKVGQIELLVTGDYVKKADYEMLALRLFEKLDKIEEQIQRKVDRDWDLNDRRRSSHDDP